MEIEYWLGLVILKKNNNQLQIEYKSPVCHGYTQSKCSFRHFHIVGCNHSILFCFGENVNQILRLVLSTTLLEGSGMPTRTGRV